MPYVSVHSVSEVEVMHESIALMKCGDLGPEEEV